MELKHTETKPYSQNRAKCILLTGNSTSHSRIIQTTHLPMCTNAPYARIQTSKLKKKKKITMQLGDRRETQTAN